MEIELRYCTMDCNGVCIYIYKEVYNRMYQGKLHVAISRRDRTLKNDALGLGGHHPKMAASFGSVKYQKKTCVYVYIQILC